MPGQPVFQAPVAKKKGKGCLVAVGVVVGLLVLGGVVNAIGGGGKTSTSSATTAAPAASGAEAVKTTQAAKTEAAAPGVGTLVGDKDLEFTITAFTCDVTVKDYSGALTPQGKFCQADLTIKNKGKDQALVDDSQIELLDGAGDEILDEQ